jgi:hypothetical protein
MGQRQKIRIRIDDVELPMAVSSADEEKLYRDAAAHINKRILSVKQKYPDVPNEKYYTAIVMLELAAKGVSVSNKASVEPYQKSIVELSKEINEVLGE